MSATPETLLYKLNTLITDLQTLDKKKNDLDKIIIEILNYIINFFKEKKEKYLKDLADTLDTRDTSELAKNVSRIDKGIKKINTPFEKYKSLITLKKSDFLILYTQVLEIVKFSKQLLENIQKDDIKINNTTKLIKIVQLETKLRSSLIKTNKNIVKMNAFIAKYQIFINNLNTGILHYPGEANYVPVDISQTLEQIKIITLLDDENINSDYKKIMDHINRNLKSTLDTILLNTAQTLAHEDELKKFLVSLKEKTTTESEMDVDASGILASESRADTGSGNNFSSQQQSDGEDTSQYTQDASEDTVIVNEDLSLHDIKLYVKLLKTVQFDDYSPYKFKFSLIKNDTSYTIIEKNDIDHIYLYIIGNKFVEFDIDDYIKYIGNNEKITLIAYHRNADLNNNNSNITIALSYLTLRIRHKREKNKSFKDINNYSFPDDSLKYIKYFIKSKNLAEDIGAKIFSNDTSKEKIIENYLALNTFIRNEVMI
uniref:Uncharacterized protein n=1 Tax=Faxonius propinquus nudivirus TaxID=3139431 RepID=A0AAU8GEC0_9VIRU